MLRQMVGLHLHFTDSVITRVLQSPSLKSTITYLVDTLTCLGLVLVSISIIRTRILHILVRNCWLGWTVFGLVSKLDGIRSTASVIERVLQSRSLK